MKIDSLRLSGLLIAAAFLAGLVLLIGTGRGQSEAVINYCGLDKPVKVAIPGWGFDGILIRATTKDASDPQNGTLKVYAARGSAIDIPTKICYAVGSNPSGRTITLQYLGLNNPPQSVVDNKVIDVNSTIRFGPTSIVNLHPKETRTILMHVVIPKDWPDELVGQSFLLSPYFKITGSSEGNNKAFDEYYKNTGKLPIEIDYQQIELFITS